MSPDDKGGSYMNHYKFQVTLKMGGAKKKMKWFFAQVRKAYRPYRLTFKMNTDNDATVIGLKTQVSRQVGLKRWEESNGKFTQCHLVNAWRLLYATGMYDEVREMIWDFVLNTPDTIWVKVQSDIFGIYTKIGEYENKKGVKSLAHYTENGHYVGSVKTLGDKPVGYEGNFAVTRERFTLNISRLPELQTFQGSYNLARLFQPIPVSRKGKNFIIDDSDD